MLKELEDLEELSDGLYKQKILYERAYHLSKKACEHEDWVFPLIEVLKEIKEINQKWFEEKIKELNLKGSEKMFLKKTQKIISDFKKGKSLLQIKKEYGDFGNLVLEKYMGQDLKFCPYKTLNRNNLQLEDDDLKIEIINSFTTGISEQEILLKYGDYGNFYLKKIKEIIKVPNI